MLNPRPMPRWLENLGLACLPFVVVSGIWHATKIMSPEPAAPKPSAATVKVDTRSAVPEDEPYSVNKAGAYGCTSTVVTMQIEAAIALGSSLNEIAAVRPDLVAECITIREGTTVTTVWSGRARDDMLRVRKPGERYVHWVPRRFVVARKPAERTP